MRAWTAALVSLFIVTSAATVAAAPKKAKGGDFGDLFAAVDHAGSKPAKASKHGRTPEHKAKAARSAHASAHAAPAKPAGTLVAAAQPRPSDALVLSDNASDRHAWVGP